MYLSHLLAQTFTTSLAALSIYIPSGELAAFSGSFSIPMHPFHFIDFAAPCRLLS